MKEIDNLIKHYDGEIYNLCYELLSKNKKQLEVFSYVCINLLSEPEEKSICIKSYFSEEEILEYTSIYGGIVNGIIKSTVRKCDFGMVSPDEFYAMLWNSYCTNFHNIKEKAFAFYYTIIDTRIPYVYIGKPLSMEQNRYMEIRKANKNHLEKIEYIFNTSYSQKTEIASLILQCIDNVESFESKVIILVNALELWSSKKVENEKPNLERIIKEIDRRIEELEKGEE